MAEELTVINNEKLHRFEIALNGEIAFLEYRFYKADIALMHTLVPGALEGKGLATALAKYAFNYAKQHNFPVMVYCPFVAIFLKRHPEYNSQVDKKYTSR
jgi:predicted GNAT family acetyltransferase